MTACPSGAGRDRTEMQETAADKVSNLEISTKVGVAQVVTLHDYVPVQKCNDWLSQVLANSSELETRFEFINSYGSSWYLDIEHGVLHYYHANAAHTNELLYALPDLIPTLSGVSKYLVAPDGATGLPCRSRSQNLGPYWVDGGVVLMMQGHEGVVHADYEGLAPYPQKLFDPDTRAYSAVLSLAMAASGGNLKIWQEHQLANEEPLLCDQKVSEVAYKVGTMTIFDSFCYHRILPSQLDDDHRFRAVAAMHFLYLAEPYPHWEYWF